MMHILFLLILSVCLTAEPIELTDKNSYETLAHFTYTEAVEINESPLELDNREWKKNTDEFTTLNKEHQYYWIKFKINNITSRSKELYLFDERRYIFNLTYFVIKNGEIIKSTDSGCMVNGNYSKFGSSLQIFSLDVDVNESLDILIKIQNFNQLDTPYKLVSKEYLVNYLEKYNFLQGMFFAIILIMGIYNLIIYFILKNKLYLYHFIYTVLLILYQGNYFGYFYKFDLYLIPISLQSAIGGLGFLIFVIFFFEELLNIKKHLPFISKLLSFSMSFLGITLFFYLWALSSKNFEYSQFLFNVTNVFVPFYIGLILFTLYYLTYKKIDKIIKLFAIVWTLIGTAGLFLMGMHLNIISTSWGVDYYFQVAIFIESSLFSTILAFHVISLKKEKLEQEKILIQQSKFVDMGKMIKAIAHQWRQPLSEINGVVLNMDIDYKKNRLDDTRIEKHLNSIETTTAYLSKTIADFLNFFRHDKEVENFMLSSVINDAITLLSNRQVEEYNIVYIKDDNDVEIHAYKSELTQAILIILNNSIDALIGTNTTYPTILIRLQEIDEEVSIMIQDNGGGIPLDIKERIYDPYFTTKHESQGTGLGLYILKILIEKSMQGSIEASNTNNGLKTILYIPQNISTINAVFR